MVKQILEVSLNHVKTIKVFVMWCKNYNFKLFKNLNLPTNASEGFELFGAFDFQTGAFRPAL